MSTIEDKTPDYLYELVESYNDDYIFYQQGNIPFLLTFPHSGKNKIEGVGVRKKGIIDPDHHTDDLAMAIIRCFNCYHCFCKNCNCNKNSNNNNNSSSSGEGASSSPEHHHPDHSCNCEIKCQCHTMKQCDHVSDLKYYKDCPRPFIVYSKIHRKNCDFNRPEDKAYEDIRMKPHYDLYHRVIREYITKIKTEMNVQPLLLDMHGQSDLVNHILRGTKDLKTVFQLLRDNGGDQVLSGPNSILGYIHRHGIPVFPDPDPSVPAPLTKSQKIQLDPHKEHPHYNGAFTVINYSSEPININTIQVEVGFKWRSDYQNIIYFSKTFRDAILQFHRVYYLKKK
ncbi:hypothetical protein DLAC_06931 [Tieghemostelium lacteum]|uniref:N-formylglutamate amidohydrolase n=1 Tax=Tieghemostelium lacteum TaxID=361077 RepID=A0A151ZDQ8_TIELA|nr:hypothetical protein DLAC_06931 [Tieghemostelium lacteum]|eukprot:KYQ92093.1 hypothetical protein DLAC_06931 [Tieghemostelium lacteum]